MLCCSLRAAAASAAGGGSGTGGGGGGGTGGFGCIPVTYYILVCGTSYLPGTRVLLISWRVAGGTSYSA